MASVGSRFNEQSYRRGQARRSTVEPYDLVHTLSPPELLNAWEQVAGSADSDLTDEEWQLVVPYLDGHLNMGKEVGPSSRELEAKRRTINAVRFQQATGTMWGYLPRRYGRGMAAQQNHKSYIASGLYERLYGALQDEKGAERVRIWFRANSRQSYE